MCLSIVSRRICSTGKTDKLVVPQVFLLSLFKNGGYVFPFPVTGKFTGLSQLLEYDGQWLSNFIHQFPQDPQMHLISPTDLCTFIFLRWSQT